VIRQGCSLSTWVSASVQASFIYQECCNRARCFRLVCPIINELCLKCKHLTTVIHIEDFSKIWQAMGRSRTMNQTSFSIYKKDIPDDMVITSSVPCDIKSHPLTRLLYTRNCDCKMAGNLSSIYQTLIALYNLSEESFYYRGKAFC
jgi:hypothetical protein